MKKEVLKLTVNRVIDRRIINEAKLLAEDGFIVNILARNDNNSNMDEYNLIRNIAINRYKTPEIHNSLKTGLSLKFYRKLLRKVHERNRKLSIYPWDSYILKEAVKYLPDLIFCHDLSTLNCGVKLKKMWNIPLVYDAHDFVAEGLRVRGYDKETVEFYREYEKKLLKYVDLAITVNPYIKNFMASVFRNPEQYIVVDNGNFEPSVKELSIGKTLFDSLKTDKNKLNVIYSGSIESSHKSEILIKIAERVQSNVNIYVTNFGLDVEKFKKKSNHLKNIILIPRIKSSILKGFLSNFDLGIITIGGEDKYIRRSSPNKLFDYLSSGIPVLYDSSMIRIVELDMEIQFGIRTDMKDFVRTSKLLNTLIRRREILEELKSSIRENREKFHIYNWKTDLLNRCNELIMGSK